MLRDSCATWRCVHGAWDDAVSEHHGHFGKPQEIGLPVFFYPMWCRKRNQRKNSHGPRNRVAKTGPGSVICREHHLKSRNVGILCNPFSMYLQISEEKTTRNPRVNNGWLFGQGKEIKGKDTNSSVDCSKWLACCELNSLTPVTLTEWAVGTAAPSPPPCPDFAIPHTQGVCFPSFASWGHCIPWAA